VRMTGMEAPKPEYVEPAVAKIGSFFKTHL
jgi:hypothetical protein